MRKKHFKSLKLHTIYSSILFIIFIFIAILKPEIKFSLAISMVIFYIIGNCLIHEEKNKLSKDAIIEYIIVSLIVLIVIFGTIF